MSDLHFGGKNPGRNDELWIDHETGLIHLPGHAPEPVVGETSGKAYQDLKDRDVRRQQMMRHIRRQMLSRFQCTQCKRKFWGKDCRVKWRTVDGIMTETLVCPNVKCDGPTVMIQDALNLREIPSER